jgi:two-component system, NarL family, response regulator LiaR
VDVAELESNRHSSPQDRLRVVVADDDPLARRVLRDALERGGISVIAQPGTGREAVELTLHYAPDLLLTDWRMPDGDGLEVIRRLRRAGACVPIVVLSSSADEEAALAALHAGAVGFLTKELALGDLPRTLRAVAGGEAAISRRLDRRLIDRLRATSAGCLGVRPVRSSLTSREWEVLDLLCASRSTEDIATRLTLSSETVRSHVKSILRKLGVASRSEAVALAPQLRMPSLG